MSVKKQVKYDIDGYDLVTTALRVLINQYPGLADGDEITFSVLGEKSGKAMYPVSGAVIETSKKSITGKVSEVCLYPFYIIYRAYDLSEERKAAAKEWLDNLGKWLEMKEITIGSVNYRLSSYPPLTSARKLLSIARQTPAYLDTTEKDGSENWAIHISARYRHEYSTNYLGL